MSKNQDEREAFRDDDSGRFTTAADAAARPHDTSRDTLHMPETGINWDAIRTSGGITGPVLIAGAGTNDVRTVFDSPEPLTASQALALIRAAVTELEIQIQSQI